MWLSRNDILRLAPPSLQKELRGEDSTEEVKPESNGSITVEIVEATGRRPERVALGFYNVDHHIDFEQAIALANDILEKTGYAKKEDELLRQQLAAASNHGRAARLQPQANMFLQTYLNWLHSARQRVAEDLRSDKEQ